MLSIEYVAGLFDGEGYITVDYRRIETHVITRCQVKAGISVTYRPVIEKLAETFGGIISVNDSAYKRAPDRNRYCFNWVTSSLRTERFLTLIEPHLVIKREQAILALELQRHITEHAPYMRSRAHLKDHERREELLSYRADMVAKIKALKKEKFELLVKGGSHSTAA